MATGVIHPVLLSGGSGSRLWPLSRESYPKQLLPLAGGRTMLQETAARVLGRPGFGPLTVVANADHRFIIAEQLREIGVSDAVLVLEPLARNTAFAAAVAALTVAARDAEGVMLLMPADHVIRRPDDFLAGVDAALPAARDGALALFGIRPTAPATGYGYIEAGAALPGRPGVREVARFVEKPDAATAERLVADGRHLWNSGIFLLPARAFLDEMGALAPAILSAAEDALGRASRDLDFLRLDEASAARSPSEAIDTAVMEKTRRAAVVPVDAGWTDVGAWGALWELDAEESTDGNVIRGAVRADRARNSYLRSDGPLVAAIGVEDLVVVATPDVVLVADRAADQDVKKMVERLRAEGLPLATQSRRVHRPWGWYETLNAGERFQVKTLALRPGRRMSLHKHFHRSEHIVVAAGTALVTLDGAEHLLRETESLFLPLGSVHRIANPGKVRLDLIEVQSGGYLGEDDIVRFEDDYARVGAG
jgi:mannose-1-phosphate guanylyltransferase/mannose-6-phosphate isomerase